MANILNENDQMVITASWFNTVADSIGKAIMTTQFFLKELEKISEWRRPITVSGSTKSTEYIKLNDDWSDYYKFVFLAMTSIEDRYYVSSDGEVTTVPDENSSCKFPLRASFSNILQCENERSEVTVDFVLPTFKDDLKADRAILNIYVPSYGANEINSGWAEYETVMRILGLLIDHFHCNSCFVRNTKPAIRILERGREQYFLSWLTYTKNSDVIDAIRNECGVEYYKGGVLLKFGEEASIMKSSEPSELALKVRDVLRAQGISKF